MTVYLDATTLIALGSVDELDLLTTFDRDLVVLDLVSEEVTTEPARTALRQFRERIDTKTPTSVDEAAIEQAEDMLGETEQNGDVALVARVLAHDDVVIVSDDQRVRTIAQTLGATVTGTIGVIVRAVSAGRVTADEGTELIRRLDSHGLHLTGELREQADDLIADAATDRDN
ncbi:MAG: putative nucleic acid-binding protein, contains PIN domain protein [uncultured archaeon A07HN63]|nr:MAG: putative nucleic acid-binding protein, contains PIN domain protein [uncultured archaeon A07HN63]